MDGIHRPIRGRRFIEAVVTIGQRPVCALVNFGLVEPSLRGFVISAIGLPKNVSRVHVLAGARELVLQHDVGPGSANASMETSKPAASSIAVRQIRPFILGSPFNGW